MSKREPTPLLMLPDGELAWRVLLGALVGVAGAAVGVAVAIRLEMPRLRLGGLLYALWCCWLLGSAWFFARALRDQRLARPVLSLLANPGPDPAGMLGPYLLPQIGRYRACSWLVFHDTALARIVLVRSDWRSGPTLMAAVVAVRGEPPPAALCRALLRELLPASWHRLDVGRAEGLAFTYDSATKPALEDPTRRRAADPDRFPCPVFEVPEPIAFPREPFVQELERHRALVREHLGELAFQARAPTDVCGPFFDLSRDIGEIFVRGTRVKSVYVLERAHLAAPYDKQFGVRRRLQSRAQDGCLEVLVRDDDLVSLHVTRLREEHGPKGAVSRFFELDESAPAIVEPTRQEHARWRGKTVVHWQAKAGGEIHRAETSAPEPARSIGDAVDRHMAYRLEEIRRAAWGSRHLEAGYVLVFVIRSSGDAVVLADHKTSAWLGVLHELPAIRRAIALHHDYRCWFPVVVDGVRYAGLRWLPMRAGLDESSRPPGVDEVPVGRHLRIVEA